MDAAGQGAQAAALSAPMGAWHGAGCTLDPALPPGSNNHTHVLWLVRLTVQ